MKITVHKREDKNGKMITNVSKRGMVMLQIVTNGKSYTRHCKPLGDGKFLGRALDFEKGARDTRMAQYRTYTIN